MKKILQATGILGIILIMGSCGSMNSFTKKQHSHRKWKKAETVEVEDKRGYNKEITQPVNRVGIAEDGSEEKKETPRNVRREETSETVEPSTEGYIEPTEESIPSDGPAFDETGSQEPINSNDIEEPSHVEERPNGVTSTDNTTDEMTLLLVIIAVIGLPWLSMLLYEGATMRTILILILSLLGYGYFFSPFFGAALLVAIVWTVLILLGFA